MADIRAADHGAAARSATNSPAIGCSGYTGHLHGRLPLLSAGGLPESLKQGGSGVPSCLGGGCGSRVEGKTNLEVAGGPRLVPTVASWGPKGGFCGPGAYPGALMVWAEAPLTETWRCQGC